MVNTSNKIYRWDGSAWRSVPGDALDIGIGGSPDSIWIVGTNRRLYEWNAATSKFVAKAIGSDGDRITVDNTGRPWMINTSQAIYVENGDAWTRLPGSGRDIAAGANGDVWLVGNSTAGGGYTIHQFIPSTGGTVAPDWTRVTGSGTAIAVAATGTPWIVNNSQAIYRNRWE
jgi:hypothetical protein